MINNKKFKIIMVVIVIALLTYLAYTKVAAQIVGDSNSQSSFSPLQITTGGGFTTIKPKSTTWRFQVDQLGGSGTRCLEVNNSGLFAVSSAACRTGSGNVSTSTAETSGYVPYWTSTGATPATLGSDSGMQYNATADRLTVTYATTTSISSSASAYFATGSGNVGIGTGAPTTKLSIDGDMNLIPTGGVNRNINFGVGLGSTAITLYNGGTNLDWGWGLEGGRMVFYGVAGGSNSFVWRAGGALTGGSNAATLSLGGEFIASGIVRGTRLGAGTTPSTYYLDVLGTAANATVGVDTTFRMMRATTGGQSWGQAFDIKVGRWKTPSAFSPDTRADFVLKHASDGTLVGDTTVMTLQSNSNIGFSTTTPQWLLNPFSSTAPQISLSAGAGIAQWAFRNAGGNFYAATTTVAGTATSTLSGFSILGSNGNVGIASNAPGARLTVEEGDVYIASSTRGIILKSPDGTCARGTIDNSDVLSFASVTCP